MKPLSKLLLVLFFSATALVISGCSREPAPPETIAIGAVPAALQKAFSKTTPTSKQMVDQIVEQLKVPNYALAISTLQALSSQSGLTKDQNRVVASSLLAVNQELQTAQAKGDATATRTLQNYRANK